MTAGAAVRETVYVVTEYGYDHHRICSIFTTREAAEAERAYCHHTARAIDRYPEEYDIEEFPIDVPLAAILVRARPLHEASGLLVASDLHFSGSRHSNDQQQPRQYEEVWPDGTFADVWARTVEEGLKCIEEPYRERRWRLRHLTTWPAFGVALLLTEATGRRRRPRRRRAAPSVALPASPTPIPGRGEREREGR